MTMAADDFGKPALHVRLIVLAGVLSMLVGLPVAALLWMTAVPGRSYDRPLPPLDRGQSELADRLRHHVEAVAGRPHNTAHWRELARTTVYLEGRLEALGYQVRRQRFDAGGIEVRNIEAVVAPAAANAETLVIGAHYDSWFDAPGANDNATGTAAVLELARLLSDLRGRSSLRIRLVLFVNEEPPWFKTGQMGSDVYARALKRSGEPLLGMMSLETLGFYSDRRNSQHYPPPLGLFHPDKGDFVAFVGLTSSRGFVRRAVGDFRTLAAFPSEGGVAPGFVGGVDWSDHWAFERIGVPALMVTDTAPFRYPYYHSVEDTPEKVDYQKLARVVGGLERVIRHWARPAPLANPGGPR
jgi:Peptidase family M28